MTREKIADGLQLLTLQLANGDTIAPPEGHIDGVACWTPHEWAYIKGFAAAAIIGLQQRLVVVSGQ